MTKKVRLGMLTPSSNTVLEPMSLRQVADLPDVSVHFSRLRVTEISLTEAALAQFDQPAFLAAAQLLADARANVIAWNGTSSAWKGFDQDEALCQAITAEFGMPATTSMLALNIALEIAGARRIGLVTPYLPEVQARIIENYRGLGYEIAAERHLGEKVNYAFAEISPATIGDMIDSVAAARPDAILTICTNMAAAAFAAEKEAASGIALFDSVTAVVWHSLRLAGIDTAPVKNWGTMMAFATSSRQSQAAP